MTADAVGGVWNYALELSRVLARHDVDVVLATMGPPPSHSQREDAGALANVTLREGTFQLEWMEDPWDDVHRAGAWLLDLAEEMGADLVHLNGYVHATLPWCRPVLVVGHSCVLSWWQSVRGMAAPSSWDRYREAVANGLRAADMIAAPSAAMLEALRRHYGLEARSCVIPNGRDADEYREGSKRELVLSAGRLWDESKNVGLLVKVAPRLPWPVLVAGDDVDPSGVRVRFDGVTMLGRLTPRDLASWYERAAIYVLPARYEPFGLSALEAALAGCALVLGDIESLREIWEGAALFVSPDDHEGLESAVRRLIENPEERAVLAARAQGRARGYSTERMTALYLAAYCELMDCSGRVQSGAGSRSRVVRDSVGCLHR